MSNKTQLSNNNDKLASLIQELANKAAGGGSGGAEMCTVTLTDASEEGRSVDFYYVSADGWSQDYIDPHGETSFETRLNSFVLFVVEGDIVGRPITLTGCEKVAEGKVEDTWWLIIYAPGDCTFQVNS